MAKLTQDRRYVLSLFERLGYWGFPPRLHLKKWRDQVDKAVRAEQLEADGYGLFRITPAGRSALSEQGTET
jgi:hypothetical protein